MNNLTLILVMFIISGFTNKQNKDCECISFSFNVDSDNADLIFKGVALAKRDSMDIRIVHYTFKINKVWKGNLHPDVIKNE